MSYEIITYSPDTGTDEHGDYKTQQEARRGLKLYKDEPAALIYDLDRWRIVYRRGYWPARALPIERGVQRLIILFILLLPLMVIWETAKKS